MDKQTPTSNKPYSPNSAPEDSGNTMNQNLNIRKDQESRNLNSQNQKQLHSINTDDENARSDEPDEESNQEFDEESDLDSDQESDQKSDVEVAERPTTDQWKVKMNSAKHQWNKLQQDELLTTEGRSERISELVQKRYSVSKTEADKQVAEFFSKH